MNKTRSPIKDAPLRNPAQSVEEAALDFAMGRIFAPCMVALAMVLMAALEWLRYYMAVPPRPWLYTLVALAVMSYAGLRTWRAWPKLRQLRQAADGERTVGQFLERLREGGYHVFHDLVGDGFNVDHVAVGPAGVFSIETKTFSKPVRGDAKIHFDGQTILVNGITPERDPSFKPKRRLLGSVS